MPNIIYTSGANIVRGWRPHEDYTVSLVPADFVVSGGEPGVQTVKDLTYSTEPGVVTFHKSDLLVSQELTAPLPSFASLTPEVCGVDSAGQVEYITAGNCTIEVRGRTGRRRVSQTLSQSGASIVYTAVTAIASGSLREYLLNQQIAALAGVTPGSDSQRAHATAASLGFNSNYGEVNPNNFLRAQDKAGFDALPLSALDEILAGSGGSVQWRAWISPHHYLSWFGHGSTSVTGSRVSLNGEICVAWSEAAWEGAICKLLPANWEDYLPESLRFFRNTAIPHWSRLYNTYLPGDKRWVMPVNLRYGAFIDDPFDPRRPFQRTTTEASDPNVMATSGDSGSPGFMGIGGHLVPFGITSYHGMVSTVTFANFRSQIDEAMNTLAAANGDMTVYAAETIDLGPTGMNFTNYA